MRSCDRRAVADRPAISCGPIGNCLAIGWRLFLERMFTITTKVYDCLETSRQPIGDRSAISQWPKTVQGLSATTATGQTPVANQSPTSPRPPCDHQKSFYDRFGRRGVSFAASKTSLRPNRPYDIPATRATCRRPPCDPPATSLRPPEIMVARRSPTGCKLCVTGA